MGDIDAPRIIVAGHICLDIIPSMHSAGQIEPGRLLRVGAAAISTGGAVANTGLALHRLGVAVGLMGKVGDDLFGRALIEALSKAHPSLACGMTVTPGLTSSYSIVISPPGVDRTFLHCPGANDHFTASDVGGDLLKGARLFHFGYPPIMRAMFADEGAELQRMFARVRQGGLATSLDMALPDPASEAGQVNWHRLLQKTLPLVDVFMPSIDELLFMLNRPLFEQLLLSGASALSESLLRDISSELLDMGATLTAIKLGEQGLYVRTTGDDNRLGEFCRRLDLDLSAWSKKEVFAPCFDVKVAGTTGSGDATIAGFLAALLRGATPADAATAATAVGACSVEQPDATSGICHWGKIEDRMRSGWPRRPANLHFAQDQR